MVGLFAGLFFRIGGFGFSVESSYICIIYILAGYGPLAWLVAWAVGMVGGMGRWRGWWHGPSAWLMVWAVGVVGSMDRLHG